LSLAASERSPDGVTAPDAPEVPTVFAPLSMTTPVIVTRWPAKPRSCCSWSPASSLTHEHDENRAARRGADAAAQRDRRLRLVAGGSGLIARCALVGRTGHRALGPGFGAVAAAAPDEQRRGRDRRREAECPPLLHVCANLHATWTARLLPAAS
jgi:hypothetical protein